MTQKLTHRYIYSSLLVIATGWGAQAVVADTLPIKPLPPGLSNKLKQVPILDLAQPKLESPSAKPLGLPVITASASIKQAILNHETKRSTPYTPKLAACQLIGVSVELDNRPTTLEWLFTPENRCGGVSRYQAKTFWVVQQTTQTAPTVLLAERAYQVRVLQNGSHTPSFSLRTIETYLKGDALGRYTQKRVPVRCLTQLIKEGANPYASRYGAPQIEVQRGDTRRGNGWVVVEGTDAMVAIDQHYRCPMN